MEKYSPKQEKAFKDYSKKNQIMASIHPSVWSILKIVV